jgi:signal peptidase II
MSAPAERSRRTGRLALLAIVLATIGCDRVTKHVATATLAGEPARYYLGNFLWVGYAENAGGFLSLGASWPPAVRTFVFTTAAGLLLLALAIFAIRRHASGWQALGIALFVAGGASNWIDRILRGSVVDFLNVGIGPVRTGIFNVADVAILLGAIAFLFGEVGSPAKEPPAPVASPPASPPLPIASDDG